MQEEVEHKSVVLATKTTKLTGQCLAKLMKACIRKMQKSQNTPKEGKQAVKRLAKGGTLQNIKITNENIKAFEPIARKYGISYALQKDITESPPKWLVFFQSKDTATMTAAFKEFSALMLNKDKSKSSVRDEMKRIKELVKNVVGNKTKNKNHGAHEL